jgi:xanthine dehydrogenase YagS FAD-binding subunit
MLTSYDRPGSITEALESAPAGERPSGSPSAYIAGGTDLIPLIRAGLADPRHLVDLRRAQLPGDVRLDADGALTIGAAARMSDVAMHPLVRERVPVVEQALLASASPQVRNVASIGGNLLQRTRCSYFRDAAFACNKRSPGSGCPARDGDHRRHAIFGGSEACVAVHASDLAVALVALGASLTLRGPRGQRRIPLTDFYLLPEQTPSRETLLEERELILAVVIPSAAGTASAYIKVRERASFEFALVAAAAALRVEAGLVATADVVLGGVAACPWRLTRVSVRLVGQPLTRETIGRAVRSSVTGARPLPGNAFKVELACRTAERALAVAGGLV